ncbi:MAG: helix-turn-helix domain-containing protein [Oscillospiraceae bacterium]|jgi:transcriptional regulator with XRE-family HTH domain|nr:helix-turn-helix domain-containing protein [Oscillospiraceae bacterium]
MPRIIDGQTKNLVGPNVRKYRLLRGYSQQQLADKLETIAVYVCRGSVSRVEEGLRTVTDIEVAGLAEILDVPIMVLFGVWNPPG